VDNFGGHLEKWRPSWIFKWPIGQIWPTYPKEQPYQVSCFYRNLHDCSVIRSTIGIKWDLILVTTVLCTVNFLFLELTHLFRQVLILAPSRALILIRKTFLPGTRLFPLVSFPVSIAWKWSNQQMKYLLMSSFKIMRPQLFTGQIVATAKFLEILMCITPFFFYILCLS
jgi:hypothetical protein